MTETAGFSGDEESLVLLIRAQAVDEFIPVSGVTASSFFNKTAADTSRRDRAEFSFFFLSRAFCPIFPGRGWPYQGLLIGLAG